MIGDNSENRGPIKIQENSFLKKMQQIKENSRIEKEKESKEGLLILQKEIKRASKKIDD